MSVVHSLTCMLYITVFIGYGNCEVSYTRQATGGSGIHVKVTREKLTTLPDDLEDLLEREGINETLIHKLELSDTSTEFILDRAFTIFKNLTEVEISCSRYIVISQCAFANSKIEMLVLFECVLKPLPTTCIIENLKKLYLYDNQAKYVVNNAFGGYVSLEELILFANEITYIEHEAFLGTKLRRLFLQRSKLKCIPDLGAISSTLIELDISHNDINQCDIETQSSTFPWLGIIYLSNNGLSKLPIICNLSPRLSTLYINDNNFVTLEDFRDIAPELYQVKLDNNPIVCDCRVAWLKEVDGLTEYGTLQCSISGPNSDLYWRQLDKSDLEDSCPTTPHIITTVDTPLTSDYTDEQTTQIYTIATTYSTATGKTLCD